MYMRKISIHLVAATTAALALSALASSCTVKEDRVPCPCTLYVSFGEIPVPDPGVSLLAWDGSERFSADVDTRKADPYWVKRVHKGSFELAACLSGQGSRSGAQVRTPKGEQCDSLYAAHVPVDASGEEAFADIRLLKQFATITVDMRRTAEQMAASSFVVEGNTCGFSILDFNPIEGAYHCTPKAEPGATVVSFRVPRQVDNSLMFNAVVEDVDLGDFKLGEMIAMTGYDWKAESLSDILVTIDMILGKVVISVEGWEDGVFYPFIEQ